MHLQPYCHRVLQKRIFVIVLGLIILLAPQTHAGLIHQYQLNGDFLDDFGGPALVPAGGTLGITNYTFAANQGLSLSSAFSDSSHYSIEVIFHLSTLSSYRKLLDFKNLTTDHGLYDLNTALNFYPIATGPSGAFSAGIDVRLIVTRNDSSEQFFGYVNGIQHVAFTDSLNRAVFNSTNNIIQFFKDDSVTSHREASAGVVDLIRIYDAPLSASQVAALGGPFRASPVPEPSTLLLLASAGGLLGGRWLCRKRIASPQKEERSL